MKQSALSFQNTANQSSSTFRTASSIVTPFVQQEKLYQLNCCCDVEKNGYIDLKIKQTDKFKIFQVFRIQNGNEEPTLRFVIKFQKTGTIAIEFLMKDITGIYAANQSKGMLSLTLSMAQDDDIQQKQSKTQNMNRQIIQTPNPINSYKVLLSNMAAQLLGELCNLLKDEVLKKQKKSNQSTSEEQKQTQPNQNSIQELKKRKLNQITNPKDIITNPRQKIRKLTQNNQNNNQVMPLVEQQQEQRETKENLTLGKLPWDVLRIIFDYTPRKQYINLRVNKEFYKLINQRKKGLSFCKNEITSKTFFDLIEKSKMIKSFQISQKALKNISQTAFEKNMIHFPNLIELDLLKYQNINESSLSRLINSCIKSLRYFKVNYQCNGLGMQSIVSLSKCKQLKTLQLGEYEECYSKLSNDQLNLVKRLIKHKQFTLQYLTLYQADKCIIEMLSEKGETESLMQLCIVQFIQDNKVKLEEIENIKKFKNLQSFNLCSSYYPLEFQVQLPDAQNDQQLAVAGSRELELILFSMKNNLRILSLGQYAYDELINYVAEICKNIEKLEINSDQVTDRGLTAIFRKSEKLKYLDLSACPNFIGVALYEVEQLVCKELKRFVVALQGYEKQKVQEKLSQAIPECMIELRLKKSFKINK